MEFTSSGTKGFQLNEGLYNIPKANNMYGVLEGINSKLEITIKFYELGWSVRKSSWNDYEVETEWAKLCIEGEKGILINGLLDERKLDTLGFLLNGFGLTFSLELYCEDKEIKRTISNK